MGKCYLPSRGRMGVTVHGTATELDINAEGNSELRRTILDIYTLRYGSEWERFLDGSVYVRIEAKRMFTFNMEAPSEDSASGPR